MGVIDFTIVAFSIFMIVKVMNVLKRKPAAPAELTRSETLLTEIRDVLKPVPKKANR